MTESRPPCIETRSLGRTLPSGGRELTIIEDISLSFAEREFVAILGPSGSGKSTLLGLIAGLDRPSSGEVLFRDRPLQNLSESELALWRRQHLGFVFQSYQLLANLTARENILLPLELIEKAGDPSRDEREARVEALLASVHLSDRGHHYPSQLSGGEQQRIALARAFAARPALLLADEPTGNLDSAAGRLVLDLLIGMRAEHGTTLVLVTHDASVGERADRRIYLRDGRVERIDSTPVATSASAS